VNSVDEPDWKPAYKALKQVQAVYRKNDCKVVKEQALRLVT
jgi:hypothetical protein